MINKLGIMKKGKVWRKVAFALGMLVFFARPGTEKDFLSIRVSLTHRQTWIG